MLHYRLKSSLGLILLFLLGFTQPLYGQAEMIKGIWEGNLSLGNGEIRLVFHISADENGVLYADY